MKALKPPQAPKQLHDLGYPELIKTPPKSLHGVMTIHSLLEEKAAHIKWWNTVSDGGIILPIGIFTWQKKSIWKQFPNPPNQL